MTSSRHTFLLLAAGLGLGACGLEKTGPSVEPPPVGPTYRSAGLTITADNILSGTVLVEATGYARARLRIALAGAAPHDSTPWADFAGDRATVPILGLRAETPYRLILDLATTDGTTPGIDTLSHTTGTLPAWIPSTIGTSGAQPGPGFLALALPDGGVIIDNSGQVVWYHAAPNGVLNSFQAHANGTYTILRLGDPESTFHVLDIFGRETGTLRCLNRPTRFHDILVQANGDRWMLCDESRVMDLSGVGGQPNANVMGTVVQHIAADGTLLFEWSALDHFAITDAALVDRNGVNVNFTHGNAVTLDLDGNLLLSSRTLNEITKIDVGTGNIMWRLGGLANQFTFANDPNSGFVHQHGLRVAGPNQILLLDNGAGAPSRLVRYLINPVTMVATMLWEAIDSPTTFTPVGGSTDPLPGGGGLVSFGRAGRVLEVDAAGNRNWELVGLDGTYIFRAHRIGSLYQPGR